VILSLSLSISGIRNTRTSKKGMKETREYEIYMNKKHSCKFKFIITGMLISACLFFCGMHFGHR
jgi:phosphatidylglycerophosphate synthase